MRLKFSKESIDTLGLDGESLHLLEGTEVDELTELTLEERENLKKYLVELKSKELQEKSEEILITNKSSTEEVTKFLRIKLGFKEESIEALGLDGESLFLLTDSEIDELTEINTEEKEKLKKFLNSEKSKKEINKKRLSPSKPKASIDSSVNPNVFFKNLDTSSILLLFVIDISSFFSFVSPLFDSTKYFFRFSLSSCVKSVNPLTSVACNKCKLSPSNPNESIDS